MVKTSFISFCFLLFSFTTIYAQVAAGVTDNLIVGQKSVHLAVFAPNSGDYDIRYDSLDFNSDGQYDALFTSEAAWVPDYVGGYTGIQAMHPGFEIILDSTNVRALVLGDSINDAQTWSDSSTLWDLYSTVFVSRFWGITGQLQQYGNWLPPNSTSFVGFRIITAQYDTLYGWCRVTAGVNPNGSPSAGLTVNGLWAIQHDPSQTPYAVVATTPEKTVYCHGDSVIFQANTVGAEQIAWHFWDGSTDTATAAVKILPDSTVTLTFEASNQNGTTTVTQILEVSPLKLTAPDITLDCTHPTGTLAAETNIPADICWVVGNDTTCNPVPPAINFPAPITVIAEDEYGCIAVEQIEILIDVISPDVSIEFDEENHLLIAHSGTPGVTFYWVSMNWPVTNDSVFITQSGTYTVIATAPNGCTTSASILVIITSTGEPLAESVRFQPNPASDFLQIENRLSSDLNLKIFDAAGCLQSVTGAVPAGSVNRLDIACLHPGLYMLAGYDFGGKPLFFRKFVKQ